MPGSAPLVAVTFDFWNTLCRADPATTLARRKQAWHQVARDRSLDVEVEVLDSVLEHVSALHHEGWMASVQFTAEHALDAATVLLDSVLGPGDAAALRDAWFDASRRADIELTPHCETVVETLATRGVRLGIICDVGLTPSVLLRGFLESHGVLRYFSHWSFSDEVGVYKPGREIFEHALGGLGAGAAESVHIGDIRRTDVAGARNAGMRPVRYCGVADDDDPAIEDARLVFDDLRMLLDL